MRFGYCADLKNAELVARLGFDYIECPAAALSAMSDADFLAGMRTLRDTGLSCETTNLFLPKDISVYETDRERVRSYFLHTFDRLGQLGVQIAVFGSGGARRVPMDLSMRDAQARFIEFTRLAAELALPYDITIALEPLNFRETNFMLTEADALELVQRIELANVGLILDLFHYAFELKPMDSISTYKDTLCHLHLAEPFTRKIPRKGDYDYAPLFAALKSMDYTGRASIEAGPPDEAQLREALAVLQAAHAHAACL